MRCKQFRRIIVHLLAETPAELIPLVKEFGFEGIIAKRKGSCYESGKRSGAWLKYKINKGQAFVIGDRRLLRW
jgi:bifunctional non-homologous end joining protein LigD